MPIYSMSVSLDGFIAGPGGEIDWSAPDPELHRFHNEQTRELGAHFCGRRLYETMVYWETADQDPSTGEIEHEFARIWQALPKIVEGRVNGFYKDNVLVEQAFAKDNKKTVGKVLEEAGVQVKAFARFKVGQA